MDNISKWIILFSCLPVFAATVYAALNYSRLEGKFRVFSWFLFFSGVIQLVSLVMWLYGLNNLPLLHLYVAAGFCGLALFYREVFRGFIPPRLMYIIMGAFLLFTGVNSLFVQPVFTFNSYALTSEAVLVVIFSLSTMLLLQHEVLRTTDMASFRGLNWINAGLFTYYTSTILVFYFGERLIGYFPTYMNRYVWTINSFFSVIMYCCFIIGLWKSRKN